MYCGILVGKIAKKEGIQEVDVRKPTTRKKTGKEIWCEAWQELKNDIRLRYAKKLDTI